MNFFVRKILGKRFSPAEWANFLMKETAESAGMVFNDRQFQELVRFKELTEEEQNRIFNEVQAAGIVYIILLVENKATSADDSRVAHWRETAEKIPVVFCQWMTELGIPQEFVKIWEKLIDLRLDEYRQGVFETGDVLKNQVSGAREDVAAAFLRMETVSILSMLHITKGKALPGDPLKRHLMTWLGVLEAKIGKNIE